MIDRPQKPNAGRDDILARAASGTLIDALFNEWGRHWFEKGDPFIETLAAVHNSGDVDLLALITPEAVEPYRGGTSFFAGQNIYRALIGKLEAPVEAVMRAVDTLLKAAGRDGAASLPVEEFSNWCATDRGRSSELLDLVDRNVPEAERYLTIALKHGVAFDRDYFTDRAYGFLEAGTEVQRQAAINALGQIAFVEAADYDRFRAAIESLLQSGIEDATRATIIAALSRRLKDAPSDETERLIQLFKSALSAGGESTHFETARVLASDLGHLPAVLIDPILETLLDINPDHRGTIEFIDYGLERLVESGRSDRAREYVEKLFEQHESIGIDQFNSLTYKLVNVGGKVLEDWVVAWLRKGDFRLCKEMDEHLFGAGSDEFVFDIDFSRYALSDAEYSFLARKVIGSFFLKARIMASLLLSLVRSAPPASASDIQELLVDPVLVNYSGVARNYLEPIAEDEADTAASVAKGALQGLAEYIGGLQSIGSVPELHPSERERQIELQRHSDQMAAAWEAARKKSIFASIIPETVMLYGNRAISWMEDSGGESKRIETRLASFGHSFEIPRVDTVDPLGLQLMLISFREEQPPA